MSVGETGQNSDSKLQLWVSRVRLLTRRRVKLPHFKAWPFKGWLTNKSRCLYRSPYNHHHHQHDPKKKNAKQILRTHWRIQDWEEDTFHQLKLESALPFKCHVLYILMTNTFLEEWVPVYLIMPPVQEETVLQIILQSLAGKVKTRVYFIFQCKM